MPISLGSLEKKCSNFSRWWDRPIVTSVSPVPARDFIRNTKVEVKIDEMGQEISSASRDIENGHLAG